MKHPSDSSYSPEKLKAKAQQLAEQLPYTHGCVVVAVVNAYINVNFTGLIAKALLLDARKNLNKIIRKTK